MIFSNLTYLTATPDDLPTMKALAKKLGLSFTNLFTSNEGIEYFHLTPSHFGNKMRNYSPDNPNRKHDFTVQIVTDKYMTRFLAKQPNKPFIYHFHFPTLLKTNLPFDLFKQIFQIDREDITIDREAKQVTLRHIDINVGYYLLLSHKRIAYAAKVVNGVQEPMEIPSEYITLLKSQMLIINHKR